MGQERKSRTRRPWVQRWFSPITTGSFRGSALTLISSMIGVGFMTLPVIGKNNGLYMVVFFVFLSALISWLANLQIGIAFRNSYGKTYAQIVERINGPKASLIVLIFLFLYVFASAGGYYIFATKFGYSIMTHFKILPSSIHSEQQFYDYFVPIFFLTCFLLSLPKKLTALRYASVVTALINFLIAAIMVIDLSGLHKFNKDKKSAEFKKIDLNLSVFSSYCLSLFSVVNQFSVVNILSEYKNPTQRRITKLVTRAPIIPLIIYILVATTGYWSCGSNTPDIIINRAPVDGANDTLMNVGKSCLLVSLMVGITLRTQTNRAGWFGIVDRVKKLKAGKLDVTPFNLKALEKKMKSMTKNSSVADANKGPNRGFWTPIFVSWLMAGIPSMTAILLADHFLAYIETAAGFLAPVFLILFPGLMMLKMHKDDIYRLSSFKYALVLLYLIAGMVWSYSALGVNLYLVLTSQRDN